METYQVNGCAYGPISTITPSGSPYTWTNTESVPVVVFVSAGTVTAIDFSPDGGASFMSIGLLGGAYRLNPGNQLKLTYAVAPTVKYCPN